MIDQFAAALRADIRESIESHSARLLAGQMHTLEEYKYAVGVIRGLSLAEQHVQSLLEKVQKANDDD